MDYLSADPGACGASRRSGEDRMNRRDTVEALLALGVLPFPVWAQPAHKVYRIGVLSLVIPQATITNLIAPALREIGYEQGRNIDFDFRLAEGHEDRLMDLAAALVAKKVDLIVAMSNPEIQAAKRATSDIPIVMASGNLPVELGLVASLAHPGGNVTGTVRQGPETAGKMVEVIRDMLPHSKNFSYLWDPSYPGMDLYRDATERAGAAMGIRMTGYLVRSVPELDRALSLVAKNRPDALLVALSGVILSHRARVIEFAAKQRLPALYSSKTPISEGGLISYAADSAEIWRRTASIIDRVLKGTKPAEIPVEQPTRFELVINLKTAKELGLKIPQSLLIRADRVIE